MDRTELQPILRASPAKVLDILYVEDQLDDGLTAPLPLGGPMQHDIRTTVLSDEFNDPVARQAGRLETEVLLIKPRRFLDVPGIDHQPVERLMVSSDSVKSVSVER